MASNPLKYDVVGAPFNIGDKVHVISGTDETFDQYFLGRTGNVIYLEYECGCGQSFPDDPMIGVKFRKRIEEFWKEELQLTERKALRDPSLRKAFVQDDT